MTDRRRSLLTMSGLPERVTVNVARTMEFNSTLTDNDK